VYCTYCTLVFSSISPSAYLPCRYSNSLYEPRIPLFTVYSQTCLYDSALYAFLPNILQNLHLSNSETLTRFPTVKCSIYISRCTPCTVYCRNRNRLYCVLCYYVTDVVCPMVVHQTVSLTLGIKSGSHSKTMVKILRFVKRIPRNVLCSKFLNLDMIFIVAHFNKLKMILFGVVHPKKNHIRKCVKVFSNV
jgi:hypothetical protein